MKKKETERKYTICHPVVFAMVMKDAELCRELLQRILPERKIKEIRFRYAGDEDKGHQDIMHPITVKDPRDGENDYRGDRGQVGAFGCFV